MRVTGEAGAPPVVQFEAPLPLSSSRVEVIAQGEGRAVGEGDAVVLALTSYDGETGEPIDGESAGRARVVRLTREDVGGDLFAALDGATEGSRILLAQPVTDDAVTPGADVASPDAGTAPTDASTEGGSQASASAQRMLVVVVDVLPTRATGDPVEVPGDLGVTVGEDPSGAPTLTVEAVEPPTEVRVVPIEVGSGAPVLPGSEVTVQYHGVVWGTGEVYDSTWAADRGPQTVAVDETFPGLREALLDQPVGSRVLVLSPAAQAFGDAPLAMVVDVLAASGPAPDDVAEG